MMIAVGLRNYEVWVQVLARVTVLCFYLAPTQFISSKMLVRRAMRYGLASGIAPAVWANLARVLGNYLNPLPLPKISLQISDQSECCVFGQTQEV